MNPFKRISKVALGLQAESVTTRGLNQLNEEINLYLNPMSKEFIKQNITSNRLQFN